MLRVIVTVGVMAAAAIYGYIISRNQQQRHQQYGNGNRGRDDGPDRPSIRPRSPATDANECGICTRPLIVVHIRDVLTLGCGDRFCSECMVEWRRHSNTCPVCGEMIRVTNRYP